MIFIFKNIRKRQYKKTKQNLLRLFQHLISKFYHDKQERFIISEQKCSGDFCIYELRIYRQLFSLIKKIVQ